MNATPTTSTTSTTSTSTTPNTSSNPMMRGQANVQQAAAEDGARGRTILETDCDIEVIQAILDLIEGNPEQWLEDYAVRVHAVLPSPPMLCGNPDARFSMHSTYTNRIDDIATRHCYAAKDVRLQEEMISELLRRAVSNLQVKTQFEIRIRSTEYMQHTPPTGLKPDLPAYADVQVYHREIDLRPVVSMESPWPSRICANCGIVPKNGRRAPKFKHCGGCRVVAYCGTDCQRAHWRSTHRAHCNKSGTFEEILAARLWSHTHGITRQDTLPALPDNQEPEHDEEGPVDYV